MTLGPDADYTIATRAIDVAGHATAYKTATLKVDTADPVNTTAVPAGTWSNEPLELALTGTDARSGLEKMQWRVDGGTIHDGDTAVVDEDGVHALETRAVDNAGRTSAWRSDTVRIDATVPVNTTPAPAAGWRKTAYTVVVAGEDGDGSGVDTIERTIDGGTVSNDENVTISGNGVHVLRTRIVDNVGHASAWREDTIRIDGVDPDGRDRLRRRHRRLEPRRGHLHADGRRRPLRPLRADAVARRRRRRVRRRGLGGHGRRRHAHAGARRHRRRRQPRQRRRDRPGRRHRPGRQPHLHRRQGEAHLRRRRPPTPPPASRRVGYSVDGGAYQPIAPGGSFTLAKGTVARARGRRRRQRDRHRRGHARRPEDAGHDREDLQRAGLPRRPQGRRQPRRRAQRDAQRQRHRVARPAPAGRRPRPLPRAGRR